MDIGNMSHLGTFNNHVDHQKYYPHYEFDQKTPKKHVIQGRQ